MRANATASGSIRNWPRKWRGLTTKDADMAAWIMISNSLLNLDETVTKE